MNNRLLLKVAALGVATGTLAPVFVTPVLAAGELGLESTITRRAPGIVISNLVDRPLVVLSIDSKAYEAPVETMKDESGKLFYWIPNFKLETDEFKLELFGKMYPDPSIAYGLAVTDFGAPSSFIFGFFTPIVPTSSPNLVSAGLTGGLLDLTGDGVSITPLFGPDVQLSDVFAPATVMGVDIGTADSHGPVTAPIPAPYNYGAFSSPPNTAGPAGTWTGLSVTTAFTLSGGGDVAVLAGGASIVEGPVIPEANTVFAGGVLAAGIAGWFWRRRTSR